MTKYRIVELVNGNYLIQIYTKGYKDSVWWPEGEEMDLARATARLIKLRNLYQQEHDKEEGRKVKRVLDI